MTFLADNDINAHYYYILTVLTGMMNNAGTTAKVFMIMFGDEGETKAHGLEDKHVDLFQVGSENWFLVACKRCLGNLKTLIVWHDCSGMFPTWLVPDTPYRTYQLPYQFLSILSLMHPLILLANMWTYRCMRTCVLAWGHKESILFTIRIGLTVVRTVTLSTESKRYNICSNLTHYGGLINIEIS